MTAEEVVAAALEPYRRALEVPRDVSVVGHFVPGRGNMISMSAHQELMRDRDKERDLQMAATIERETAALRRKVDAQAAELRQKEREIEALRRAKEGWDREFARYDETLAAASRSYDELHAKCVQLEAERDEALATAEAISIAQSL